MNLTLETWVLYSPTCDLVSLGGTCLDPATNYFVEYHAVIGLLIEDLTSDVRQIRVYLDLELFVHQLNLVYTIRNPLLLCMFWRVQLLERYFEYVSYHHIPRDLNVVANLLANYVLDW